eukprot:1374972-Prymnesium_polylepis.2
MHSRDRRGHDAEHTRAMSRNASCACAMSTYESPFARKPQYRYIPTDEEKAMREERAGSLRANIRTCQMHFAANDVNDDRTLDLLEFAAMLPESMRAAHSHAEIKVWFDAIDSSGDGRIDECEFFLFSLKHISRLVGTKLEDIFRRFDLDGDGKLDKLEFSKA